MFAIFLRSLDDSRIYTGHSCSFSCVQSDENYASVFEVHRNNFPRATSLRASHSRITKLIYFPVHNVASVLVSRQALRSERERERARNFRREI